jgi:DNA primase
MNAWIDFKALRAQLKFEDVLRHYGVEVKDTNHKQHHGYCPLPNHNGKKNSPSFSANLERGIFNCFGCGAKGNLIDFAVLMSGGNPADGADVRKTALHLQESFGTSGPADKIAAKRHVAPQLELPHAEAESPEVRVVVNAPLDFELKNLDANHPYLEKRGFNKETIHHFGLGFCSKGLLSGRVAIPVHSPDGKLTGYAGRLVDDASINEENPRYKFPPKRERKGVIYEFHKMELVYNSHRIRNPVDELLIVEGFPSVWWLTQMGFPYVIALMGWAMSERQAEIIIDLIAPEGRAWVISDGDESGNKCAASVFEHVAPKRSLRWLKLDHGKQPTDYPGGWYRTQLGK